MFEGSVSEQLHQFIASSRTSLPLPLSFPLHASTPPPPPSTTTTTTTTTTNTFSPFDPYNPPHQHIPLQPDLFRSLHHQSPNLCTNSEKQDHNSLASMNLQVDSDHIERAQERSISQQQQQHIDHQWTSDEVVALLRIRSCMDNWFPDFSWEHVSRKLAEVGFKRSGEKCKEKFEEESRFFSDINYNKNYRFLTELEQQLYDPSENNNPIGDLDQKNQTLEKSSEDQVEDKLGQGTHNSLDHEGFSRDNEAANGEEFDQEIEKVDDVEVSKRSKKRKKQMKFEMFKGFCEEVVNKMMAQQEEMHNKLIEDMVNREKEKVEKEEVWKKKEMERMNKELEVMAHEQAIAGDRQAIIIEFLKQFTSSDSLETQCNFKGRNEKDQIIKVYSNSHENSKSPPANSSNFSMKDPNYYPNTCHPKDPITPTSSATMVLAHKDSGFLEKQNDPVTPTSSTTKTLTHQNPNSTNSTNIPKLPTSSFPNANTNKTNPHSVSPRITPQNPTSNENDIGKRWPRDEVLALINLRCGMYNNGEDKEGVKAPLWERISQGMLELGYKRSAKRCKEKWENINKYFRKTKDANKKRSIDSRTCPYFHQLSTLYNQGKIVTPIDQEPENHSALQENLVGSSQNVSTDSTLHVPAEGERTLVQVPSFDFDF